MIFLTTPINTCIRSFPRHVKSHSPQYGHLYHFTRTCIQRQVSAPHQNVTQLQAVFLLKTAKTLWFKIAFMSKLHRLFSKNRTIKRCRLRKASDFSLSLWSIHVLNNACVCNILSTVLFKQNDGELPYLHISKSVPRNKCIAWSSRQTH